MELIVLGLFISLLVGIAANSRGRSFVGWTLLSVLITPILALLLLLVLRDLSRRAAPDAPRPDTHVRCPDCRELVLADARKCRHCGCVLVPQKL